MTPEELAEVRRPWIISEETSMNMLTRPSAQAELRSAPIGATTMDSFRIGERIRPFDNPNFNGLIDDVRVYNRALSAAEVSKLRRAGWQYRKKKITIGSANVAGSLTDFPVLISLANDLDLKARAQASGADILFTAADGTKLSHEIEKYDPTPVTGATLVAWVKVPSLSPTANTDLYMYYGDAGASDQQDKTGVWKDSSGNNWYAGVWHLKESGNGTTGEFKDSTSNGNHGQGGSGTAAYLPTQIDGRIGKGQNFDGTNDHINIGTPASLNITGTAITLEAWVRYPTAPVPLGCSGNDCYYGILNKGGYNDGYRFMVTPGQRIEFQLTGSAGYEVDSQTTLSANNWYHVVSVYDGVSMKNYIKWGQGSPGRP